jgi:hypothetical protein
MTAHTASDFSPPAEPLDEAHDIASEYARAAAAQVTIGLIASAIILYRQALSWFDQSRHPKAAERITFVESEIGRLAGLDGGVSQ